MEFHASKLEKERRIERVIQILGSSGYTMRAKVISLIIREFKVSLRQAETYVKWAREIILEHTKRTRESHIEEMLITIDTIIYNENAVPKDRLNAMRQKALLLGLNAPVQHQIQATVSPVIQQTNQERLLQSPALLEASLRVDELLSLEEQQVVVEVPNQTPTPE